MSTNKQLFYERCKDYFGEDTDRFIELLNKEPTSAFFINEKKCSKEKIFELIDFDYSESLINIKSFYTTIDNIGKTKAYELGAIYPQDVESSLPSSFIDTENVKYAIDLCAAPGGKTINVLNRLSNDCLLISNDVSYKRASILSSNLERLGLDNTVVTSSKPNELANKYEACFDLVILDAPCSGEGMIRKYPEILDEYSLKKIIELSNIQKDLLEDAYKLLRKNGQLLYSTCTYAFEEDEYQIKDFIDKHNDIEIIKLQCENNYSKLDGTIKLCPLNNTEGQFMCLMRKKEGDIVNPKLKKVVKNNVVEKFIKDNLNVTEYFLYNNSEHYCLSLIELIDIKDHVLNQGVYLGELKKDRFEPSHTLYRSNSLRESFRFVYELSEYEYNEFVKGNELKAKLEDNYYLLTYKGLSIGYGKCSKGILKNKYPKGLRKN